MWKKVKTLPFHESKEESSPLSAQTLRSKKSTYQEQEQKANKNTHGSNTSLWAKLRETEEKYSDMIKEKEEKHKEGMESLMKKF